MKLLIAIIVFSFSYADLKIKTKNDELILKSGHSIFYVNQSKKKHMYNYFESNLIRRLAGLLYISDVNSGNARKRALDKISK